MAENIADHGGVEGDTSQSAVDRNVQAIEDASNAAGDDTVYLPEGTWYVGPSGANDGAFLVAGQGAADNLSFTGDGPERSVLKLSPDVINDGFDNVYRIEYAAGSYDTVRWEDVTYDVNWQECIDNNNSANAEMVGLWVRGDHARFEFYNFRLLNVWRAGIVFRPLDRVDLYVDRCEFRNIAIGRANREAAQGGIGFSHCFASVTVGEGGECEITNSAFSVISGNVVNCDDRNVGEYRIRNCWMEGIGDAFNKDDGSTWVIENLHYRGYSEELEEALNDPAIDNDSHGRQFVKSDFASNLNTTSEYTLNNVDARDFVRRFVNIREGNGWTVGGGDEPVRLQNSNFRGDNRPQGIDESAASGAGIHFDDFGSLSVHDGDTAFTAPDSSGRIETLHYGNISLGETGDISVGDANDGGDPFEPDVPSREDVGPDSDGEESTLSWGAPTDGDTVAGPVTVQLEPAGVDEPDAAEVEYRVDDDSWTEASYNSETGYFEGEWDGSSLEAGEHTLEARLLDAESTSSIGVQVVDEDSLFAEWTPRWESTLDDWAVVRGSDFDGGQALAFEHGGDERTRYAISCDPVGTPADVELLDKFRVPAFTDDESLGFHARSQLRCSGEAGDENGYWLEVENRTESFRLAKYTDGRVAILDRFGTPREGTFYYRRFRAEGDELRAKVWPADEDEPAEWDVEVTDGDHDEGWVGLGSFDTGLVETDVVSVATGGETAELPAPAEPPSLSWERPSDGDEVEGTVTLQLDAGDADEVAYRIDGDSWTAASYNTDTGYYEDEWDAGDEAADRTLEARAENADGTAEDRIEVTVAADTHDDDSDDAADDDDADDDETVDGPTIERFEVIDNSASGWSRFDVDWTVAHDGGELDTVVTKLRSDGTVVAAESTTVTGDEESYTHVVRVRGDVDDVVLAVNDTENRTATEAADV